MVSAVCGLIMRSDLRMLYKTFDFAQMGSVITDEGFQACDTLQDSTDNSSIDKVETSLE